MNTQLEKERHQRFFCLFVCWLLSSCVSLFFLSYLIACSGEASCAVQERLPELYYTPTKKKTYIYIKLRIFVRVTSEALRKLVEKFPNFIHIHTHTHTHTRARMYISILIHLNRKFFLIRDNDGEEGGSAGWKKRRQEKKFLLPPQPREREREREREGEGEGKKEARICMTSSQS